MSESLKQFVNCHQHSDHSIDGAATIEQIIKRNLELGCNYTTLTEHGNLNSAMELYHLCHKMGAKPILGIELYLEYPFKEELSSQHTQASTEKDKDKRLAKVTRKVQDAYVHLTVHFKDAWAYQYFCNLTPAMEARAAVRFGDRKPIATWQELAGAAGHITIGSGCIKGPSSVWLMPFKVKGKVINRPDLAEKVYQMLRNIAGPGNFFVELFPHRVTHEWKRPVKTKDGGWVKGKFEEIPKNDIAIDGDLQYVQNRFMLQMAQQYGDPILISLDSHYATKSQKTIQNCRLGNGREQWQYHGYHHIMSTLEVATFFQESLGLTNQDIEKFVENSYKFASLFDNFKILTNKDRWVLQPLESNFMATLNHLIGKYNRMDWQNPEMTERLQHEIKILAFNGQINLLSYFFTIEDIADFCKNNDILINVRGSGSGSLLLYLIGVSSVNPLKHDLSFERFLTEGRIRANTLPDVDMDVSTGGREQLLEYLTKKYGDRFCQLSVDSTLRLKSSIKDAERTVSGKVDKMTEVLCKVLPSEPQGVSSYDFIFGYVDPMGDRHLGLIDTNAPLQKYATEHPDIWSTVCELVGIQRQKSTHACGIVITDRPVQEYCPTIQIKDTKVTGFSPKSIELAGLVKYDILGLNTLFDIQNCLKSIEQRFGITLDPWNLPYDSTVFEEFGLGRTETVFQFDTETVRPYLIQIKPNDINELAVVTALVRPGTMDALHEDGRSLSQVFVARRQGEPINYIHSDLEPILGSTLGIAIYQEQTINIFKQLAGYTAEQAEEVRRGIGKKDPKILAEATTKLKEQCLSRGWTAEQATLLVNQIMASARYAFNKSHAISYAYVAYACMYLKVHYPLDWWKAILSDATKNDLATKFWKYVSGFTKMPDINSASGNYEIVGDFLVAPIAIVNGVGEKVYQQLIQHAPYRNIQDLVGKHLNEREEDESRSAVHSGIIRKLIAAGVLDSLFEDPHGTIEDKLHLFEDAKAVLRGKTIEPIPEKYIGVTDLGRYLIKKELIPIYSLDLRPLMLPSRGGKIVNSQWTAPNGTIVYSAEQLEFVKNKIANQEWCSNDFCCLGYVISEKVHQYQQKTKQMTKLLIDVNGTFFEEIVWPSRNGDTAPHGFQGLPVLVYFWSNSSKMGIQKVEPLLKTDDKDRYTVV